MLILPLITVIKCSLVEFVEVMCYKWSESLRKKVYG